MHYGWGVVTGLLSMMYSPNQKIATVGASLGLFIMLYGFGKTEDYYSTKIKRILPEGSL
jgi:uncharacterized membrane protein